MAQLLANYPPEPEGVVPRFVSPYSYYSHSQPLDYRLTQIRLRNSHKSIDQIVNFRWKKCRFSVNETFHSKFLDSQNCRRFTYLEGMSHQILREGCSGHTCTVVLRMFLFWPGEDVSLIEGELNSPPEKKTAYIWTTVMKALLAGRVYFLCFVIKSNEDKRRGLSARE